MSAVLVKPPADTEMPADQGPTDAKNASFRLICRDIIPGLRLCECTPDGNKKGAHLQPSSQVLGTLIRKLSCALVCPARKGQDITRTDNYYT